MFSKTSFVFSLCASCAYAAFVPPDRLDLPIILGRSGRPMVGVTMGTQGAGQIQNFNFTLSTSLGYTSVASKGCGDCSDTPTYDVSLSPNAKSLDGTPAVAFGSGNYSGKLIKENCTLSTTSGTSWSYPNQTIVLTDNQSQGSPFQNGISGIIGLGTLKKSTNAANFSASFDDGLYGQYYIRNPEASNFTFGMALKPSPVIPSDSNNTLAIPAGSQSLEDSDAGTVHWLQPDSSAYQQDQVQWRTVQSVSGGYLANSEQPDWTVSLDGWSAKIGNLNVGNGASMMVNVDPYYSGIYMPGTQAHLIHDAIPGSQLVQKSTISGQTTSWHVPCNTAMQFTVSIGSQQFTVDQSLLVVNQGDGTCISLIEGFTDSGVTQYIFGQNWLSQLYVIFNIPKDGNAALAFAPRAASSKARDIGAIVGGTVGGVAGVVALGLLVFYFIRRRQDNSFFQRAAALDQEHKVAGTVEPYTFGHVPEPVSPTPTHAQYAQYAGSASASGYGSPPISPHVPLLAQDAELAHQLPPSYEEASESGPPSSSREHAAGARPGPGQYPREKQGYRQEMLRTANEGTSSAPTTPNNQTSFSGSSAV
ncbi:aspartic peptidase domain-containing protein [Daedaleopsis nitida]|nr:aspartic peptidase domain-containing protein [Daedaleopsis nitida]